MKRLNYYLGLLLVLVFASACHDEFDQAPVYIPVADAVPNMTIAEFKAKHWQDGLNYVDTITDDEVIHGWVTANDVSNNIYRTVYITDGSGNISISVMQNELYEKYRIGQEIVLPMKGHYVGKATGQMNIAAPYYYVNKTSGDSTLECYQMPSKELESYVQFNLLPDVSKVDTIDVSIGDFQGQFDAETLRKYQGMLVRIKDVEFVEADGKCQFADASSTSTNRTIKDRSGKELIVRNSRSADFATQPLPLGRVDIVGIISYYQTSLNYDGTWQFYLRTIDDILGDGRKGTKSYPYSVADAIEAQGTGANGWVGGYIVGAVGPEVATVNSNSDIEWTAPTTLDNTIVIADSPDCKDYTKCIIVSLPQGSQFRTDANLKDESNSYIYKAHIKVLGDLENYMGAAGITGNTGSTDEYEIDVALLRLSEGFNSSAIPSRWTNIAVSGGKQWSIYSYAGGTISCAQFRPQSSNTPVDSWLITPRLDIKNSRTKIFNFTSEVNNVGNNVIEVYLLNSNDPRTATVKVKLNPILAAKPTGSNNFSAWTPSGDIDLSDWADGEYYIGFNFNAPAGSNYSTWCIDDVTFGMGEPPAPKTHADFETLPGRTTKLGNYTTDNGWAANNCTILEGGETESNPVYPFIGYALGSSSVYAKAPTINGGTATTGSIVSPVLNGGMKKLSFKYGYAYSGKKFSFRVDVKQNGVVVKSWTITDDNPAIKTAHIFEENCSISGDFTIEFTNLCPSNATGNKDRVSIWNVLWE